MQEVYFLTRHIPFWAVPLMLIAGEFAYLFWLRKKKKLASFCVFLCILGVVFNVFYIYSGGPEKSVKSVKKIQRDWNQ
ncbi:MAG TPA: hypothetical protein VKY27_12820 [Bacteriovoracaceae bacterium]|nr:hypothetical protein [Bacteriovoracaceae bacterium]